MKFYNTHKMITALKYLAESVLPLLFWVSILFGFDDPDIAVLTIVSALIHELGHMIAIILTERVGTLKAHVSGFRIKPSVSDYRSEIFTLSCGPLFNLIVFVCLLPFINYAEGYILLVALINLLTAISNLLPVEGYDGFGILEKIFTMLGKDHLLRALYALSFVISAAFLFISLYFLYRVGEGYWIFGVFFVLTLSKIKRSLSK